ncbi:MAG: succinate--CoA ligase subunit alpha [Casimicrobiaceae bacterium]
MSILLHRDSRILVQGITGGQAQVDTERALRYGARIVAGVTPGRGGERVHEVPVFDTVARAVAATPIDATAIYAPPLAVRDAALESIDAAVPLLVVMAEGVPLHDVALIVRTARESGVLLVGCNTNGVISPGKSRIGGIGGVDPSEIYVSGRIGICSRSGGMAAELALTLKRSGLGVSTCVSMGGDRITGLRMADYARMFEADEETEAIVVFGEPGTGNEQELAGAMSRREVTKPVVALIAGAFQERYPAGRSFGHAAALIQSAGDTASAKRKALEAAGAHVAQALEDIPRLLAAAGVAVPTAIQSRREGETDASPA